MEKLYIKFMNLGLSDIGSQTFFVSILSLIAAYFDSTLLFLCALLIGFAFNIFAGMRADDVKIKGYTIENFDKKKFSDSLIELMVISIVTYILKGMIDLMQFGDRSAYVVQVLIALALYYYVRNGLRNLSVAYPNMMWIVTLYHLFSFQFRKFAPDGVVEAMDRAEKEIEQKRIKKDGSN